MLITRETDYALRILRSLQDRELHTAGEVCKKELVPNHFAYKILKKLERGSIIEILRGADGGCRLAVDLNKITLHDLLLILEQNNSGLVSPCVQEGYLCEWREAREMGECIIHNNVMRVQDALEKELRAHTLYQMIQENSEG